MRLPSRLSLISFLLAASAATAAAPKAGLGPEPRARLKAAATAKAQALMPRLQAQLGLPASESFAPRRAMLDPLGQTHVRFQQFHQGVKVMGAEAVLHFDTEGNALEPTVQHLAQIPEQASVQPGISAERATALATKDLQAKGPLLDQPLVELVMHPNISGPQAAVKRMKDGGYALDLPMTTFGRPSSQDAYILAYHVQLHGENQTDGPISRDYILDAQSGVILRKWNSLETLAGTPDPTDSPISAPVAKLITGHSEYRGDVTVQGATLSFQRTALDGTISTVTADTLLDTTRGTQPHPRTGITGNLTKNMANDPFAVFGFQYHTGLFYEHTDPGFWGDGQNYDWVGWDATGSYGLHAFDSRGETAGLDAHAGIADTWDFYKNVFGRDGIDDQGTSVLNRIHFFANYPNAYWDTFHFAMTFGDGDGVTLKTVTALDVMGHELSHGVTAYSADLAYFGESGGINESNSDIMGTMVEFYSRGAGAQGPTVPDTGGNWTIGEQVAGTNLNGALRWFDKPSKDGGFSADNWYQGVGIYDVHASSGIGNRMFYYLSNGAPTTGDAATPYAPNGFQGIGNDKAAKIWYRTLTVYLTSYSDYHDARVQAIRASTDLYGAGSVEAAAVENAFGAVNVGGLHGQPDPPMVLLDGGSLVFSGNGPLSSSLSVIAAGEYSRPFAVQVANAPATDQAVTWSLTYGGGTIDPTTGLLHAPDRWPFQLGGLDSNLYVVQAYSNSHPLQYAQGLAFPVMADADLDLEVDAVDMIAIGQEYGRSDVDPKVIAATVGDPFGVSDFSIQDFREAFAHIFATE